MARRAKADRGLKVHSLGYMSEKLKRNLPNYEHRYILTCTSLIRASAEFTPTTRDERRQHIEEMVRFAGAIETVIQRIERMTRGGMDLEAAAELTVAQDVTEARTLLKKKQQNPPSSFFHHLRERLLAAASTGLSADFRNQARELGRALRDAVRVTHSFVDEKKSYIVGGADIEFDRDSVRTLEKEYPRVRRTVVGP
ncbi:MAG: hypothetical protein ABIJ09_12710 [Pseudomonadota bacterium]